MGLLLAIDTTTKNCSVALFEGDKLISYVEQNSNGYLHAEKLTFFIEKVLKDSNIRLNMLDGIVISKGPGSYTGLRIGTSTAKGLCFALDLPLIAISTLKAMAFAMSKTEDYSFYCPMIDAKRMEVFASVYDRSNVEVREIRADIVDHTTYASFLKDKVLFFGNGAIKCKPIIDNNNASFKDGIFPSAKDMGALAFEKFNQKDFEDVAYFEPYYLKDFTTGGKKKH